MNKRYIIHFSDFHFDFKKQNGETEILESLIKDIKDNCKDGKIILLVCSGDLVQSGSLENYDRAIKFILDLLDKLSLDPKYFIYVPGNHEVDLKQVDKDFSKAFTERIMREGLSLEDIQKDNITKRLSSFFEYQKFFSEWAQEKLAFSKIIQCGDSTYGITMVNSAWNTAGNSEYEAKKIIIPRDFLIDGFQKIEGCDKKILVIHHPIDWFEDYCALELENLVSKYDFVLFGHKHRENIVATLHMNESTLFIYSPKLDLSDNENGYTIIGFDDISSEVTTNSRTYIKKRLAYAPSTSFSDDGLQHYTLLKNNSLKQLCANVIINTRSGFYQSLNSLFIVNLLNKDKGKSFDELFVPLEINKVEEIDNENRSEDYHYSIEDVFKDEDDVVFWGKKESGKTIYANYIAKYVYDNYQRIRRIPVVVDCQKLGNYKSAIEKMIISTILDLIDSDKSIKKEEICTLLKNSFFVLILDNFDKNSKSKILLDVFKENYQKNKIIIFKERKLANLSEQDKTAIENIDSKVPHVFFIDSMSKHGIRMLAKKLSDLNPSIEDGFIDKIIYSFSVNNIPRTPFAVSLILSICNEKGNYAPTNQAKILQAFIENILERLNPDEILTKTFNFENKERFLAQFSYFLFEKKTYHTSEEEFFDFTKKYHDNKGYSLKDSKFDRIFFEKGILVLYEEKVFFRYDCLKDYYLAKYFESNRQDFYEKILSRNNYLIYRDTVEYYAGLVLDDEYLIEEIANKIKPKLSQSEDADKFLRENKLRLNISDEEVKELTSQPSYTKEEKDEITNKPDNSQNYVPMEEKEASINNCEATFDLEVELLGSILKNSEELSKEVKERILIIFFNACVILWKEYNGILTEFVEALLKNRIEENGLEENDIKDEPAIKEKLRNYLKLSVPMAISQFIFECIGTEKLNKIFVDYHKAQEYNSSKKVLSLFLLCDLKNANWLIYLNDYINNVENKYFLSFVFYQCLKYQCFDYFDDDTRKIIDSMVECCRKLNNINKISKSEIKKDIVKKLIKHNN